MTRFTCTNRTKEKRTSAPSGAAAYLALIAKPQGALASVKVVSRGGDGE